MELTRSVVRAFEQHYPHIKVEYEPVPDAAYETKLLASLAAGNSYDVFLLDSKLIPSFTNKKILLDLTQYLEPLGIDTAQWFPQLTAIARGGSALYAFPKGCSPLVIYYNKKLFDEAGIPYPNAEWTWNDYLNIARKLTRDLNNDGAPDQYGTVFSNYYAIWIPWVWSAGGDVLDPTGTTAYGYLNGARTQEALRFLIELRTKYHVAPESGTWVLTSKTGAVSALLAQGKVAMVSDGHWRMPRYAAYIAEGKIDIGAAPLPRHPLGNRVNVLYESGWCVPVSSPHPNEAALLASFLAGPIANEIFSTGRLELPAVRAVALRFAGQDTTGIEEVFRSSMTHSRQPWGTLIERWSELENEMQDAVDEIMLNGAPMEQTLTRYAGIIDARLTQIRANASGEFKPIREHSDILRFLIGAVAIVALASFVIYTRAKKNGRHETLNALGFLAPSLLHLAVFVLMPILFAAYLSVHRWDIVAPETEFIGAANFVEIFSDNLFWNALKNTLLFTLNVPFSMALALMVALLVNRGGKGIGLLRTLCFLPTVTSLVALALVWMWIYQPSFGLANAVLRSIGLPPSQWLNSSDTALLSVMIFSVWMGMGYQMVIFLAGLQGIPSEMYEAAIIDGAGRWQKFRSITIPLLKPTTFFILVTSFIASFQVFAAVYVMTRGGPLHSTDVMVHHIYNAAWGQLQMGYAAALSWVLFVIIMGATWLQFKLGGRTTEETA